jgi:hypothetical protein
MSGTPSPRRWKRLQVGRHRQRAGVGDGLVAIVRPAHRISTSGVEHRKSQPSARVALRQDRGTILEWARLEACHHFSPSWRRFQGDIARLPPPPSL